MCVRQGKKCELATPSVNFSGINKAIEKLEREEIEAKAALNAANAQINAATKATRIKRLTLKRLY